MSSDTPTPLLVVGRNRSGTKWLSNLLIQSEDIFGLAWPNPSTGVLESDVQSWYTRTFPSLRRADDLVAFVELWSQAEDFRLTGLTKDELYERRPRDPIEAFRFAMETAARRAGCRYWLQKYQPTTIAPHTARFPDARWIAIHRDRSDTMLSALRNRQFTLSLPRVARVALGFGLDDSAQRSLARRCDALRVRYEDLRRDTRAVIEPLAEALGIPLTDAMLVSPYPPNTSFPDGERPTLGPHHRVAASLGYLLGRLMPGPLARRLNARRDDSPLTGNTFRTIIRARKLRG